MSRAPSAILYELVQVIGEASKSRNPNIVFDLHDTERSREDQFWALVNEGRALFRQQALDVPKPPTPSLKSCCAVLDVLRIGEYECAACGKRWMRNPGGELVCLGK